MKVRTKTENLPAVQKTSGGFANLPALPGKWETELAEAAKADAAVEQPTTQAFSLKSGVLSYNNQPMPGNKMNVIVVASAFENSYFINKFDPNNIVSPLCFALSEDGEDMVPHDNSFKKQGPVEDEKGKVIGHACTGCEFAAWASDTNSPSGRGKACKEVRRLAVMPVDALEEGVEKAAIAMLRVPVTSVRNWAEYVHTLSAVAKRPSWTVITEISVVPDAKNQFQVKFTPVDAITDVELIAKMQLQRARALQAVMNPYGMMTQEQYDDITKPARTSAKRKF